MIRKHDGGPCPVDGETLVVTKLRGGWVRKAHEARKAVWPWSNGPDVGQIVAWRLAEPTDLKE